MQARFRRIELVLTASLVVLVVGVTKAAPATYVNLTPGARVVVNNVPKYPSEGEYGAVGTGVSKIKLKIRRVNDGTGAVYISPIEVQAGLTPEAPPDPGYVTSGTWSGSQEIEEQPNCRYYSKAVLYKKKANGQHDPVPAIDSDWQMH
jgi:hypothetical protein